MAVVAAEHIGLPADGDGDVTERGCGSSPTTVVAPFAGMVCTSAVPFSLGPPPPSTSTALPSHAPAASCTASASAPAGRLLPVLASTRTTAAVENFVASRPPSTTSSRPFVTTTSRATGAGSLHPTSATRTTPLGRLAVVFVTDVPGVELWESPLPLQPPKATARMTTQTTPHHARLTTRASRLRKTCSAARRVRWDREPEAGIGGSDVLVIVPIVALAISRPGGVARGSNVE